MAQRAQDWLVQAERDLKQARLSASEDLHEWSCFAAHQAAGKAVKAIHLAYGQEMLGHALTRLVRSAPVAVPEQLFDKARILDLYYIPPRYPNAHSEGSASSSSSGSGATTAVYVAMTKS